MDKILQLPVACWEEEKASPILLHLLLSSPSLSGPQVFICSLVMKQAPSRGGSWYQLHEDNVQGTGLITLSLLNYRGHCNESCPWCYPPGNIKFSVRLIPTMVEFERFGPPAQNTDVHIGMCSSLPKWINSKFNSRNTTSCCRYQRKKGPLERHFWS